MCREAFHPSVAIFMSCLQLFYNCESKQETCLRYIGAEGPYLFLRVLEQSSPIIMFGNAIDRTVAAAALTKLI